MTRIYTRYINDVDYTAFAGRLNRRIAALLEKIYTRRGNTFNYGVVLPFITKKLEFAFPESCDRRVKRKDDDFYFEITPLAGKRLEFSAQCKNMDFDELFDGLVRKIEADYPNPEPSTQTGQAQNVTTKTLSRLEQGIIEVCTELQDDYCGITDEHIAERLAQKKIVNPQGEVYSRVHICNTKNKLRDRGLIKV